MTRRLVTTLPISSCACEDVGTPPECVFPRSIFSVNATAVQVRVPDGHVVRFVGWTLPSGGSVSIYLSDGDTCDTPSTIPFDPCQTGAPMQITETSRVVYLGPGTYDLVIPGGPQDYDVSVDRTFDLSAVNLLELQCRCPCEAPPSEPTDVCSVLQSFPQTSLLSGLALVGINGALQCVTVPVDTIRTPQTVNGDTSAHEVVGISLMGTGQNNIEVSVDLGLFCEAVRNCVTRPWRSVVGPGSFSIDVGSYQGVTIDASAGPVTVVLVGGGTMPLDFKVKRLDLSSNVVSVSYATGTVDGAPSVQLEGLPSLPTALHGEGIHLHYTGAPSTNLLII